MKRFLYLAAVAAGSMMLASCSNEEVIASADNSNLAISFKAMANKSGRAEVTTANIDCFRVYGCSQSTDGSNHLTLFDNVTVSRDLNVPASEWEYSPIQYWTADRDYYFIAISTNHMNPVWDFEVPTSHDVTLSTNNFWGYGKVSTAINTVNAERDLVYACSARSTDATISDASKVSLEFYHMLSRIGMTFKNGFTNNYTYQVSEVKISGLIPSGSVTLGVEPANLDWKADEGAPATINVTVPDNNNVTTTTDAKSANYFIIPGKQPLGVEFKVTVMIGSTIYSVRTINGTINLADNAPFKSGVSYMFTATINESNIIPEGAKPIEFTVKTVNGWATGSADVTIGE